MTDYWWSNKTCLGSFFFRHPLIRPIRLFFLRSCKLITLRYSSRTGAVSIPELLEVLLVGRDSGDNALIYSFQFSCSCFLHKILRGVKYSINETRWRIYVERWGKLVWSTFVYKYKMGSSYRFASIVEGVADMERVSAKVSGLKESRHKFCRTMINWLLRKYI